MNVTPVSYNNSYVFGAKTSAQNKPNNDTAQNPISRKGEIAKLVKLTFLGGLALGARLLFELFDGDFVIGELVDKAEKIAKKQSSSSDLKRLFTGVGAFAGLVAMFVGGFALLYTLFKSPKISYDSKVNTFQKSKEMDVYIKTNKVEKELYTQMNEKAKGANEEEKNKLKEQYLQMQAAKNEVPNFINLNRK